MADLKLALRTLTRTPFLSAIAVLSLALGIGANAAIFSIFDQILLQPLPVVEPDRLVNLAAPGPKPGMLSCNQAGECDAVLSYPMYRDLERERPGFTGLAGHRAFGANLARGDRTVDGEGMLVSGTYFSVLGLRPALGRLLQSTDDQVVGEHPVAVLSHGFWQRELGGDPDVLNGTITVNGRALTVVGVAPRGFQGTTLGARPAVFVPLSMRGVMEPAFGDFQTRRAYWVYVFGRLAPDVSLEQATVAINRLYRGIILETEAPLQEGMSRATLEKFRAKELVLEEGPQGQSSIHQEARAPLYLLLGITGLVLLIACANIANLLLARGARRSTEMAIRGSLGAGRAALLRQLLTESLLLAGVGGLLSLVVAWATLRFVGSMLPPETYQVLQLDPRLSMLLFTAAVALATGILFGLYPAIHATRADLLTTLRAGSGQTSGGRAAARFRSGLVIAQIALSMALLVAAGLFIRSLANVSRIELGVDTERTVTFGVSPALNGYEPERSQLLFERLEEELGALPGVTAVSAAMVPILSGNSWGNDVSVEGFESGPDVDDNARLNVVGPGYFRTLGIPLVAGREFTAADDAGAAGVAIVNEAFVRKFGLPPAGAVGSLMAAEDMAEELDLRIVGVVQDAKYNAVKEEVPPVFFTPYRQSDGLGFMNFYVRSTGDPSSVLRAIPAVLKRLDPNLPVEDLKTLEQQVGESLFLDRMISRLSSAFALLATVLAAIGLYGVLAYNVAQRTREIGLRMALGAGGQTIRRMVLRQVAGMLVVGGVMGVGAALALGRAASSLLYQLQSHDPVTLLAAVVLLSLVAFGAGWVPAFRASRVDPMHALRYE